MNTRKDKLSRCWPSVLAATIVLTFVNWVMGQQVQIVPNVPTGPVVERWGWDLKGSIGLTDTAPEAQIHYGAVAANLVRIPFYVDAHFSDGTVDSSQYSTILNSLQQLLSVNPDVEVFASLKLDGGNTFVGPPGEPGWVTAGTASWPFDGSGNIFGNASARPNPEFYSRLVADYVEYMSDNGIQFDYLGLNNETDGALGVDRYIGTYDLLQTELTNRGLNPSAIKFIAPDSFGPNTAINYIDSLGDQSRPDTYDIVGSHYYPERSSHTRGKWVSMSAESSGADLWFTEAHINPSSSGNGSPAENNITRMRRGMGMVFSANQAGGGAVDAQGDLIGVNSFVWWQGGGNDSQIDDILKREIINSMIDGQPVQTTPGFAEQDSDPNAPLYQAYRQDNVMTVWLANPGAEQIDFTVNLSGARLVDGSHAPAAAEYWAGCASEPLTCSDFGNEVTDALSGELLFDVRSDKQGMVIDTLPANSISKLSFWLAGDGDLDDNNLLDSNDLSQFLVGWQTDSAAGDLDGDGDTDRIDFFYLREAFLDAGQGALLDDLVLPEPQCGSLMLSIAFLWMARKRTT